MRFIGSICGAGGRQWVTRGAVRSPQVRRQLRGRRQMVHEQVERRALVAPALDAGVVDAHDVFSRSSAAVAAAASGRCSPSGWSTRRGLSPAVTIGQQHSGSLLGEAGQRELFLAVVPPRSSTPSRCRRWRKRTANYMASSCVAQSGRAPRSPPAASVPPRPLAAGPCW